MVKLTGYDFFTQTLGSPKYIVAPMVDASELAWRSLSRYYGAQLCYTPMFHAHNFSTSATYRKENFTTGPEDRPLIVQFCGNDPEKVLKAAKYVEGECDAVDLNLGCPQGIARRGFYGAFLQDEWDLIARIVALLHKELSVPVTCKIRIFPEVDKTIRYAKMLEEAGCQLLTVHGRTREMKGPHTGIADWDHIKAVREAVKIPMFANGNILYFEDIERCMSHTGVDGVMTAEGNLFNPTLFTDKHLPVYEVVDKYLSYAKQYGTGFMYVKGHLFKLYNITFQIKLDLRDMLGKTHSVDDIIEVQEVIKKELVREEQLNQPAVQVQRVSTCDNFRALPYWRCQPYFRSTRIEAITHVQTEGELSEREIAMALERKQRREAKKRRKELLAAASKAKPNKRRKYPDCPTCQQNPASPKCCHTMCKPCCIKRCMEVVVDCVQHNILYKSKGFYKVDKKERTLEFEREEKKRMNESQDSLDVNSEEVAVS